MESGRTAMNGALQKLYTTGAYSDLVISCGDRKYNVHKAIVCSRSPYFAKACEEGKWKEYMDNEISLSPACDGDDDISKDDPLAVECMIRHMYTNDYDAGEIEVSSGSGTNCNSLSLHAKVYALGDKYEIPSLKDLAFCKFEESTKTGWQDREFIHAIKLAFTTTPDEDKRLRNVVIDVVCRHAKHFANDMETEILIRSIDGLAYDLWKYKTMMSTGPQCNGCENAHVKECPRCPYGKKSNIGRYFVACKCRPTQHYCSAHRDDEGEPVINVEFGFGSRQRTHATLG